MGFYKNYKSSLKCIQNNLETQIPQTVCVPLSYHKDFTYLLKCAFNKCTKKVNLEQHYPHNMMSILSTLLNSSSLSYSQHYLSTPSAFPIYSSKSPEMQNGDQWPLPCRFKNLFHYFHQLNVSVNLEIIYALCVIYSKEVTYYYLFLVCYTGCSPHLSFRGTRRTGLSVPAMAVWENAGISHF